MVNVNFNVPVYFISVVWWSNNFLPQHLSHNFCNLRRWERSQGWKCVSVNEATEKVGKREQRVQMKGKNPRLLTNQRRVNLLWSFRCPALSDLPVCLPSIWSELVKLASVKHSLLSFIICPKIHSGMNGGQSRFSSFCWSLQTRNCNFVCVVIQNKGCNYTHSLFSLVYIVLDNLTFLYL